MAASRSEAGELATSRLVLDRLDQAAGDALAARLRHDDGQDQPARQAHMAVQHAGKRNPLRPIRQLVVQKPDQLLVGFCGKGTGRPHRIDRNFVDRQRPDD